MQTMQLYADIYDGIGFSYPMMCAEILEEMKSIGLDYVKPDGAFYVMLVCDSLYGKSFDGKKINGSMDVADMLLTYEKVALTPGVCFGDDGCVRLSYALAMDEMVEGLARIRHFASQVK
jgi:aspartate aminotransferase